MFNSYPISYPCPVKAAPFCETDSAIPAQVIKRIKAQASQPPIHQPQPFGYPG
jgi:hypothetical protein